MASDVLVEELEVLESIYPTELRKLSDTNIEIDAEPDDLPEGEEPLVVTLKVHYDATYPDLAPDFSLSPCQGSLTEEELKALLIELKTAGEENLGIAMTFTLVSLLREKMDQLVADRVRLRKQQDMENERQELEAEEARTRGRPVTLESFKAWKVNFDKEQKKVQEEALEAQLKSFSGKEREEWKRVNSRLSGRQLFQRHKDLEEDNLLEEGAVSVDISQYEREKAEEQSDDERITFSDSD